MVLSHATEFRSRQSGFTLAEMLVSMAILVGLVLLLGHMLSQTERAWSQTEAAKERMQNARALADFVGNELRAALLPVDRLDKRSLQFVLNPSNISARYRNRDALFFQSPSTSERSLGDVAEIGYFVKWDLSNPDNPRSQLCRFQVNPGNTTRTAAGDTVVEAHPNYLIYTAPTAWLSDAILEAVAPAGKGGYEGLFAENVVGLWLKCVYYDGRPITKSRAGADFIDADFDSRQGYRPPDGSDNQRYNAAGNVIEECMLPPAVDIGLVLADNASATKIRPDEMAALGELQTVSDSAYSFVNRALADDRLIAVRAGLRSYQIRIYLQNCR